MKNTLISENDKKLLRKVEIRSHTCILAATMVNMEGNGFTFSLIPAIEEIYKDDPEGKKEAYTRHQQFFNTHAVPFSFIVGLAWAMEKEKKEKGSVDAETISSVKSALMGPTAGMFDNLFFNCLRIIAAGIGIGLAQQGNILGMVMFILIYGVPQSIIKMWFCRLGYTYGTAFIDMMFSTGLMASFTKAASILGIMMVGAMTAQMVYVPLNLILHIGPATLEVAPVLDAIFPGFMSIALLFGYVALIKKGWKPINLILLTMVIGLLGALIHIF